MDATGCRNSDQSFAEKVNSYNNCLSKPLDCFAPAKVRKVKRNQKQHPKWFDKEYLDERRLRRRLERWYKLLIKTEDSLKLYVNQRYDCVSLANAKQKYFYSNLLASTRNQAVLFKTALDLWKKKTS